MLAKNKNIFNIICGSLGFIIILVIVLPIVKIFLNTNPGILAETVKDKEVVNSILLTMRAAFYATAAGVLFGAPLAYIFARYKFYGKAFFESIVDLPIIIPHAAAGIALLGVFGKRFFLGNLFSKLGISFVGTEWGIVLAMFFVSVPFLVNSAKEGFKMVDVRFENVAMSLGANKSRAFFDITLPLAFRSILSGILMMWARGISEFGAVIILAYHPMTASVKIFERFEAYGLKYARPVASMLIVVCLAVFVSLRILVLRKNYD
ncbi:ABC transporter permease [bacterium]|nr:ABC transporter permease [bacterium]